MLKNCPTTRLGQPPTRAEHDEPWRPQPNKARSALVAQKTTRPKQTNHNGPTKIGVRDGLAGPERTKISKQSPSRGQAKQWERDSRPNQALDMSPKNKLPTQACPPSDYVAKI